MMAFGLRYSLLITAFCLVAASSVLQAQQASKDAQATVVVYNVADPSSVSLAKYYAKRRQIPETNLIGLNCSMQEEITRQEYMRTIEVPLRVELLDRGLWTYAPGSKVIGATKVRYAVLMRGMPLKIAADPTIPTNPSLPAALGSRNDASVDSELATLGMITNSPAGFQANPYFRRFTPIMDLNGEPELLLVCRLDAPTEARVRGMIDEAFAAELDGLWGWAYVDSRNIKTGGYAEGDSWLMAAVDAMRAQGIPVLLDTSPDTLPLGFPVTDAAVYYGWYADNVNGPFSVPSFRFRPGAVAVHLHSFSAATLRSPTVGWCGPLLERGAAATLGNVYEPYLALTANLNVMQDRLMAGFTFAESAYMSMRALSWMGIVVGDPLYRPYAVWKEAQTGVASSSWEVYRRIIRANNGSVTSAASSLEKEAAKTGNSMFLESLAAADVDAGDRENALKAINMGLQIEKSAPVILRLRLEKFALLRAAGRKKDASDVLSEALAASPGPAAEQLLRSLWNMLHPPPPTPAPAPSPR
jgi:uncharacterized protein (TIGR03790 family)